MCRYQVIDESQSGHCCFVATVVDTCSPLPGQNPEDDILYVIVCECFTTEFAEAVAAALNERRLHLHCYRGGEGLSINEAVDSDPEVDFSTDPEQAAEDELYYMAQDSEPIETEA